ncbi:MAG: hypothetical protein II961_06705 [Candidatus Riflebacteria bacterium]|nr:hypothetical protein [Candidatus Riflebacteria bacterium]
MNFKNIFVSVMVALSLSTVVVAQDAATGDNFFNKIKIGSTKEQVKSFEKNNALVLEQESELMFNETSKLIGKSQNCYSFDKNGQMQAVTFNIINNHYNYANYIADFNKINDALTKIYGEPTQDVVDTDNEELVKDPVKLALAIKEGEVVAITVWKKDNFTISHILSEKMSTEDMDDETKKVTVITPICHVILGQLNSLVDSEE